MPLYDLYFWSYSSKPPAFLIPHNLFVLIMTYCCNNIFIHTFCCFMCTTINQKRIHLWLYCSKFVISDITVSCFILLVYFDLWTICIYFPFPVSQIFWWGILALKNESKLVSINSLDRQNSDKTVNEIGLRRQNFEWDGAYGRHLTIFTNYIWISFSQSLWNFKKVTSVRLQI